MAEVPNNSIVIRALEEARVEKSTENSDEIFITIQLAMEYKNYGKSATATVIPVVLIISQGILDKMRESLSCID